MKNINLSDFETLFLKATQFEYLCEKNGFKCKCGEYPVVDTNIFYEFPKTRNNFHSKLKRFDFKCKNSDCEKSSLKRPKNIEAFEHFRYNSLELKIDSI